MLAAIHRLDRRYAAAAWALLAAFIVVGSWGQWSPHRPGIWAPTLVVERDVAVNVLLYVPFGIFGVLSIGPSYQRSRLRLILRIAGLAVLFSAANEALQLYTTDRVASLTDIASAAVGACAGACVMAAGRAPK